MNNGMISAEFLIKCRIHRGPELFRRARPMGEAIDGATITQDNCRIVAVTCVLQLALDMEDGPLRGATTGRSVLPRKAATKDHASSLGQDFDVQTERLADQLQ